MKNSSATFRILGLVFIWAATQALAFRADDGKDENTNSRAAFAPARPQRKAPTAAQREAAAGLDEAELEWDAKTGAPAFIRGKPLSGQKSSAIRGAAGGGRDFAADAVALMHRLEKVYRLRDAAGEFQAYQTFEDDLGLRHVRMNQVHQGLRVEGGDILVHFDKAGDAYQVNGRYIPGIELAVEPGIETSAAVESARRDLLGLGKPAGALIGRVELVVYARDVAPALAYEFALGYDTKQAGIGRWRYWINARDGSVINRFNDIRKSAAAISGSILTGEGGQAVGITGNNTGTNYYLLNTNRHWKIFNYAASGYVDTNSTAWRGSNSWGTSDRIEMSAAYNFDLIQNYYYNNHSRNSFDNSGVEAVANVHVNIDYDNAYWDPATQQFYFYPGYYYADLTVLDVCGHEYTHAVTEHTADLIYQNESGALNESFSDIFGAAIEFASQTNGNGSYPNRVAGYADWLVGEDSTYPYDVALRDMRNPNRYYDPSKYHGTYWYYGTADNGGVHWNSGVQNHFFYLLSEGGSGTNDGLIYNITGIGVSNAATVAYRTLTVYCSRYTEYSTARAAWNSAARDYSNSTWLAAVQAAWAAVGLYAYSAPASVVASGGTYTDKINVTWTAVSGANSYSLYRGTSTNVLGAALLTTTSGLAYDDTAITPGIVYYYWVKASGTNGPSDYSAVAYGSAALPIPTGLSVSQGTSADYAQLNWTASSYATAYIILRDTYKNSANAVEIGRTTALAYNDSSAIPGTLYYYWVKGYSIAATSSFSSAVSGYRALAAPEGVTASAGTYSTGVQLGWNAAGGATSYRIWRGPTADSGAAANISETSDTSYSDRNAVPGTVYYYWIQSAKYSLTSVLSASVYGWRRSMAAGNNARGDMDGDGIMDFAVYAQSTGMWYARLSGSAYATVAYQLGCPGFRPVACDYDGDNATDPAVYQEGTGLWIALLSSSGYSPAYGVLGGVGWTPVAGDCDGDGRADAIVYNEGSGVWQALLSRSNYQLASAALGGLGQKPLAADYDGDGKVDPAVYYEDAGQNVGYWHIAYSGSGYSAAYKTTSGYGCVPVPADYDGDGKADLALYNPVNGLWSYWSSLNNYPFPVDFTLGGTGYTAVPGDYDGDGKGDIAVYREAAGQWLFLLSSQNYASANGQLGGPGYEPAGAMR